jgi:dTDP-4-amino-4,6-dideoxygalactose transaminase
LLMRHFECWRGRELTLEKVKFFDYPFQFEEHRDDYIRAVETTLASGYYILGPDLEMFEDRFAEFLGSKHAIGVGNGTDALILALRAAGVGPGDEVVTVSHTFVATIAAIVLLGATAVFVDIAGDHNMDVRNIEAAITPRTKVIIPVQLNGRICTRMDELTAIAAEHGIVVVEDAAQAIGAKFKGKSAGTFGKTGCFSFYPAKVLGTFGDAGAIVTDDDEQASKLRMLRNHGREAHGEVELWGQNSRMDNVHAAILNLKLAFLEGWIERRREIALSYTTGLANIGQLKLPEPPAQDGPHYDVFQNYEIEAEGRDNLIRHLEGSGVEVAVPWGGKAVHHHEALGLSHYRLPRTDELFRNALMLPIYPGLDDGKVDYIVETIQRFYP